MPQAARSFTLPPGPLKSPFTAKVNVRNNTASSVVLSDLAINSGARLKDTAIYVDVDASSSLRTVLSDSTSAQSLTPMVLIAGEYRSQRLVEGLRAGADDFVAGNNARFWIRQLSVEHVQVGTADCTGGHPDQHLAGSRNGIGEFDFPQWLARRLKDHGLHAKNVNLLQDCVQPAKRV